MAGELDRITVSRETLRAELLALELRLKDTLASRSSLDALRTTTDGLEARLRAVENVQGQGQASSRTRWAVLVGALLIAANFVLTALRSSF